MLGVLIRTVSMRHSNEHHNTDFYEEMAKIMFHSHFLWSSGDMHLLSRKCSKLTQPSGSLEIGRVGSSVHRGSATGSETANTCNRYG